MVAISLDVSFLFLICFYPIETIGERVFNAIRNEAFDGKKILGNHIATKYAASEIRCTNYCGAEPTCLSFNYHARTGTCVLFDSDFIHVAKTATQSEDRWLYYYLNRDYEKSLRYRCVSTVPTSYICSLYCLHYINVTTASTYTNFASMCTQHDGGLMVRIDRGLKQHCVENLLADTSPGDPFIQGTRDGTSDTWKYNDGTIVTYFNWYPGQPNDIKSPYIRVRKSYYFTWGDFSGANTYEAVCQQI